jgi:hypothetical protein
MVAETFAMRRVSILLAVAAIVAVGTVSGFAGPFVLFPKAEELRSPNGRFVVRNVERQGPTTEFVGVYHSLWLVEVATNRSRKLCNYLGVAAVAWSNNDFVIITEYVTKKTSRAFVFPVSETGEAVVFDKPTLLRILPAETRITMEESDHVFVEASRIEGGTLFLRVWGYGPRDRKGFRWSCSYELRGGRITCPDNQNLPVN